MLLVVAVPALAYGADRPEWAFPDVDKIQPSSPPGDQLKALQESVKSYTQDQIDDLKNPPDWFPDIHPPMPSRRGARDGYLGLRLLSSADGYGA
jgi:hypothetical protein